MTEDLVDCQALMQELRDAEPRKAMALLQAAAEAHPDDPRPLMLMAGLLAQARDFDRAEAIYTVTLQRAPHFAIARFQLGLLQFTSGRPLAGLSTWAPLELLDEHHYLRLFAGAFQSLAENQLEEATRRFQLGLAANRENLPLNRDMERMLARLAQQSKPLEPGRDRQWVAPADPLPATATPPSEEPASESHFLLSAYRNLP